MPEPGAAHLARLAETCTEALVERLTARDVSLSRPTPSGHRPAAVLRREVARVLHRIGTAGDPAAAGCERRIHRLGALCVRRGIPVGELVRALELCSVVVQDRLWSGAEPGSTRALHAFTLGSAVWLDRVADAAAGGAADELTRQGRAGDAAHALAALVCLGHAPESLAAAAGIVLPERWTAVVGVTDAEIPLAEPALLEVLQTEPRTLGVVGRGEIVLLVTGADQPALTRVVTVGRRWDLRWARVDGVPVDVVPTAIRTARGVARLAFATALPADGLWREEDVVPESFGLGDPVLRPWLDRLAGVLDREPELARTVGTLYATDLDRGGTAEKLGIGRRTLNSRLTKLEQITGLKPTSSSGIQILGLALAAGRLARLGHRDRV